MALRAGGQVKDVTEARHDKSQPILDHTHGLARRIGLAQLPLACIATRFMQDVWARVVSRYAVTAAGQAHILCAAFACLFMLKVLTGIVLAGVCAEIRITEENSKAEKREAEILIAVGNSKAEKREDKVLPKAKPPAPTAQLGYRLKL